MHVVSNQAVHQRGSSKAPEDADAIHLSEIQRRTFTVTFVPMAVAYPLRVTDDWEAAPH